MYKRQVHDTSAVPSPAPAEVYRSVRHRDHSYRIPVPPGRYLLRIHFTDGFAGDERQMDYRAAGVTILRGWNPYREAGATHKAITHDAIVDVHDQEGLLLECTKAEGNDVFEAAIEIHHAPEGAEPTPSVPAPQLANEVDVLAIRSAIGDSDARFVFLRGSRSEHYTTAESRVQLLGLDTADGDDAAPRPLLERISALSLIHI